MAEPVCVVSGVGPGTGTALVRRFAAGGYRVAMLARNGQSNCCYNDSRNEITKTIAAAITKILIK